MTQIGRTSTVPWPEAGQRAAQESAAVEIRHVDEKVASELLLRLRVGAVEHLRFAVRDLYRRRGRGRLQPARSLEASDFCQRLHERHVGREALTLLFRGHFGNALWSVYSSNMYCIGSLLVEVLGAGTMLRQHNDARAAAISTRGADCGRWRSTALLTSLSGHLSESRIRQEVVETSGDQDGHRQRESPGNQDARQHAVAQARARGHHRPADSRGDDVGRADRQSGKAGTANQHRRDHFRGGPLRRSQVNIAEPLAESGHDALVADHGADSQAERAQNPHPRRGVLDRQAELFGKVLRLFLLVLGDSLGLLHVLELRNDLVNVVAYGSARPRHGRPRPEFQPGWTARVINTQRGEPCAELMTVGRTVAAASPALCARALSHRDTSVSSDFAAASADSFSSSPYFCTSGSAWRMMLGRSASDLPAFRVEREGRWKQADDGEHDQPDALLPVVRAMREADTACR